MSTITWPQVLRRIEHGEDEPSPAELLANYMMARGRMEIRGRGLPIVVREMREFNGTSAQLTNSTEGGLVRLVLRR